MNPLRYVHSWPSVVFACFAIAGVVGIFALAGPDERITVLTIFSTLATVGAAVARQAFAVPPPKAPKRLQDGCPVYYRGADGRDYRCAVTHAAGSRACHSPNAETKAAALAERAAGRAVDAGDDEDDDDTGEGGEVLAEEPPTKPQPRTPVRVTLSPRAVLAMLPMLLLGCSPSALQTHATIALVASHTLEVTRASALATCTALRDACAADAACIEHTRADCLAVADAQDAAVAAVGTYVDAVELAALADEGRVMEALRFALEAAARAWVSLGERLAAVGISLPALGGVQ